MCDGHSQFMSEALEYRVYCLLMAPYSQGAKDPKSGNVLGYPIKWYSGQNAVNPLIPVTDADLNP